MKSFKKMLIVALSMFILTACAESNIGDQEALDIVTNAHENLKAVSNSHVIFKADNVYDGEKSTHQADYLENVSAKLGYSNSTNKQLTDEKGEELEIPVNLISETLHTEDKSYRKSSDSEEKGWEMHDYEDNDIYKVREFSPVMLAVEGTGINEGDFKKVSSEKDGENTTITFEMSKVHLTKMKEDVIELFQGILDKQVDEEDIEFYTHVLKGAKIKRVDYLTYTFIVDRDNVLIGWKTETSEKRPEPLFDENGKYIFGDIMTFIGSHQYDVISYNNIENDNELQRIVDEIESSATNVYDVSNDF